MNARYSSQYTVYGLLHRLDKRRTANISSFIFLKTTRWTKSYLGRWPFVIIENKLDFSSSERVLCLQAHKKHKVVQDLPSVGLDDIGEISIEQTPDGEVHIYAHPDEEMMIHQEDAKTHKVCET